MNFRVFATALFLLSVCSGCGSSLPELATVNEQITSEQADAGSPQVNSIGMILIPIPAGEFLMGSAPPQGKDGKKPQDVPGAKQERPSHQVEISKPFFIGMCEVTQGQFETVMNETPWKKQPLTIEGKNVAASYISWEKAVEFCDKLSVMENEKYRLPTEAEWEYACRAGTTTAFSFDAEDVADHAWFDQNAYKDGAQYAHVAGQKLANPWSLYDMHGNVWEWCSDWYEKYTADAVTNPQGPEEGWQRTWRGGGFAENAVNLRSASRGSYGRVDYRPEFMAGFRVVKEMP